MWKARFCLIPTSYRQGHRGLNKQVIDFPNLTQLQNERIGTQAEIHISLLENLLLKSWNYNQSCFLEILQIRIWDLLVNFVLSLFKSQVLVLPLHSLLMTFYPVNRRNKVFSTPFPIAVTRLHAFTPSNCVPAGVLLMSTCLCALNPDTLDCSIIPLLKLSPFVPASWYLLYCINHIML